MRPSVERSTGLMATFVRHRNAANLLMILLVMFGIWGTINLNRQLMPNTEASTIRISVNWSGASAEDVEKNILLLIEPAVRFLDGVKSMSGRARESSGIITLEYERDTDMQEAQRAVETAVASVNNLPAEANDPTVSLQKFFDPIASIAIAGPFPELALRRYALEIRDGLLAAGVDKVEFTGYRDRKIGIEIDDSKLRQLDMTLSDLADVLTPNLADKPSGSLTGDYDAQIRAAADQLSARDIAETEVKSSATGQTTTFGDIATITDDFDEDDALGYMRGEPAIKLTVSRSATADTVDSYEKVKAYVAEIAPTLPPSLELKVFDAAAEQVNQRLSLLVTNGVTGLVLVLVILFLFLDGRIAFWVAMGIPVSILATLGMMFLFGQTINMISMFALMMTLGIIVDDAIVVGEHTATRYGAGDSRSEAAIKGAGRMAAPVIAASLTTMAAFLPILLVGDVVGQIMATLPVVVACVLAASMLECFFILPGHLAHSLPEERKRPSRFRRAFDGAFGHFRDHQFGFLADLSYRWRYVTAAIAVAISILGFSLLAAGQLKFEFFPTAEGESFNIFARFQAGVPEDEMRGIIVNIENAVSEVETELTPPGEQLINTTYANLDLENGGANFDVFLTPSEERSVRTGDITDALRAKLPTVAGVERINVRESRGGPPGRAIDVEFSGSDATTLKQASEDLQGILEGFDGLTSISDTLFFGNPEVVMSLNSRGTALGFTLNNLGTQVRDAFEGNDVATVISNGDEVTIRLEQTSSETGSGALRNLSVRAPGGSYVPLSSIVTFSEKQGLAFILRDEGKSTIHVRADTEDGTDFQEVLDRLAADYLPAIVSKYDVSYRFGGTQAEQNAAFADLQIGAVFALGLMYVIIAWIFASYFAPLAVMLIVPFGLVGAIWGHYLLGYSITLVSLMGMLGLSGILVNDSIVLISRIQERMAEGDSLRLASTGASRDRLRAVLLTSLTTIAGLVPLLFEKSLQAQFLIPMAVTIVFGLGLATLLVLFLVPAFMAIGADMRAVLSWAFMTKGSPSFRQILTGRHHERHQKLSPE
ncbi:efflux RND transporter permease subunit [Mariluticola halotolerans]|uniref:efflux RND transporter permease subunit n=1 Tax=Mariluticola halotolerans TaxID=2909283 RepID=UPI0026E48C6B|nr:efflux RND transporter permease subunit [Mariluticola halotolerans]UJQ93045.1 efflux RND transporter permease subunit [Mariluticola halotolerans]